LVENKLNIWRCCFCLLTVECEQTFKNCFQDNIAFHLQKWVLSKLKANHLLIKLHHDFDGFHLNAF
jgi:hypothetical protein